MALQRARTALESAAGKLPSGDSRVGELWALAGLSYLWFGELWCSGTPISEREPAAELGSPLATDELFGLPPLADPGVAAARVDLTFRERAFWLFLTARRLGDLRRLVRQYGRAKDSVYPTVAYHKQGLTRAGQAAFVVPQPEENNPNYSPEECDADTA